MSKWSYEQDKVSYLDYLHCSLEGIEFYIANFRLKYFPSATKVLGRLEGGSERVYTPLYVGFTVERSRDIHCAVKERTDALRLAAALSRYLTVPVGVYAWSIRIVNCKAGAIVYRSTLDDHFANVSAEALAATRLD